MLVSPGCSNALARPYIALLWLSVGNLFRSWVHRTELRTSAAVRLRRSPGIDQYGPRASATRNKGLTSFRLEGNEKESGGRMWVLGRTVPELSVSHSRGVAIFPLGSGGGQKPGARALPIRKREPASFPQVGIFQGGVRNLELKISLTSTLLAVAAWLQPIIIACRAVQCEKKRTNKPQVSFVAYVVNKEISSCRRTLQPFYIINQRDEC